LNQSNVSLAHLCFRIFNNNMGSKKTNTGKAQDKGSLETKAEEIESVEMDNFINRLLIQRKLLDSFMDAEKLNQPPIVEKERKKVVLKIRKPRHMK